MYLLIYSFMHLCYKSYNPKDFLGQIINEWLSDKHSYLPYIWKPRRLSCVAQCHFGILQNQTTQGHLSWLFIWCGFSKLNPYQILFHCNHLNQLFTLAEYDTQKFLFRAVFSHNKIQGPWGQIMCFIHNVLIFAFLVFSMLSNSQQMLSNLLLNWVWMLFSEYLVR